VFQVWPPDGKGRMTVPARHRDIRRPADDKLTVTKAPSAAADLSAPGREQFRAVLLTPPMSAEDWRRVFIGSAMDVEIDGARSRSRRSF
jgi:MraZ protein